MSKTKIRFGFRSKNQLPFFMIWKEYWENGRVVFAKVLFNSSRLRRKISNCLGN